MVKLSGLRFQPTNNTCRLAAAQGHLECLVFAYCNLYVPLEDALSIAQSSGFVHILAYAKKAAWPVPKKLQ